MNTRQGGWSPEEDHQLLELHSIHGNKWTFIAKVIGGRTDNAVKNRYHALRTKEKAKLLASMNPSKLEELTDSANSRRTLRHYNSLERIRASTTSLSQHPPVKCETGATTMMRIDSDQLGANQQTAYFVKTEPEMYAMLPTVFNGEQWNNNQQLLPPSWTPQMNPVQSTSYPYNFAGLEDGLSAFGGCVDRGSNWDSPVFGGGVRVPDFVPQTDKFSDDLDSMESSSNEGKISMQKRDCVNLSFHSEENGSVISPIPTPAPLVNTRHPFSATNFKKCDFDFLFDGESMWNSMSSSFTKQNHTEKVAKNPNLTLDLNFMLTDGLELESILHKFSPASPSAYLKSLSPIVQ
eukprot:g9261.t2